MANDADLAHQPDTFQQPSLIKKKSKLSLVGFSILLIILIILHLPFFWILDYIIPHHSQTLLLYDILMLSPIFSPLLIIDFIVLILFNKRLPPWKVCFILIFIFNVLFFSEANYVMGGYMGALNGFVVLPLAALLVIIDFIALLFYLFFLTTTTMAERSSDMFLF
jgi:hypothetical protein